MSTDAGTPSAFPQVLPAPGWEQALAALEFPLVLDHLAGFAAGPLGAARLRARRPVAEVAWVREELARVDELARLARSDAGLVAEAVPDLAPVLARLRIAGTVLDGTELLAARRTLTAARLVADELRRVAPEAPRAARLLVPLPDRALERRLEQSLDDDGGVLDTASPALAGARSEIRAARERLIRRLEAIARAVGSDGGVTVRDGRYVIPVARDLRDRPDGVIVGESASGATLYLLPASVIPLGNALREAEARAAREELRVLRELSDLLRPARPALAEVHAMCVAVDDLAARARWAAAMGGYAPAVGPAPSPLRLVHGRHPLLLASAPDGSGVVPCDLVLEEGECTVLLSGPNTGGKSVLLKAVGLHVALAQSGIVPPVGLGSALPLFDRAFADIGDRQSIAASLSTFSAHVTLLRVILEEADERTLVLLDEIGSGTDPAEGGALAGATLAALTRRGAVTLATTHLGALKRLATAFPGIVNASLQFDAETLRPTYRLVKGVPGRSYGLAIARRLGVRPDVLAEAEAQVPDEEKSLDALLAAVEQRAREQAIRGEELEARLAVVARQETELAAQAEAQSQRETTLRRRERDAERRAAEQARAALLEARETVEAAIRQAHAPGDEAARAARRTVEEAAAAAGAAIDRLAEAPGDAGAPARAFRRGARVRLESGPAGEFLEQRGDGKAMVLVGSLKLVVDPASLIPLPGEAPRGRRAPAPAESAALAQASAEASYELDLRGLTGDEAEQATLAAIDSAVLAEQPYLRIIHGKGTGAVRERVRQVLGRDRRVRTHGFAPANQGGTGVTVVEFAG